MRKSQIIVDPKAVAQTVETDSSLQLPQTMQHVGKRMSMMVIAANANAIQPRNGGARQVAQPGIG
jgi:hypothetical protein